MAEMIYYYMTYSWFKPEPANVVAMPGGQKKPPQGGEGGGVLEIHPFEWIRRMREDNGVLVSIKSFQEISKEEYDLFLDVTTMPEKEAENNVTKLKN